MYTFRKHEAVRVSPGKLSCAPMAIKTLSREELSVADFMSVPPGEQAAAGHSQRIKVRLGRDGLVTDWISGGWFEPA